MFSSAVSTSPATQLPLALEAVPGGRQLNFTPGGTAGIVHVFRRANGYSWMRIAVNAASPYVDEDAFAPGTVVEYYLEQHSVQGHCWWRSSTVASQVA